MRIIASVSVVCAAPFVVALPSVADTAAVCGGAGTGSCFTTHGPACNNAACCNIVCAADPFCCNNSWDNQCVGEAISMCAPSVEAGPIINPINGHRYWLNSPQLWNDSVTFAGTLGATLTTINNGTENSWVRSYLVGPYSAGFTKEPWIGLNDIASEGVFVWQNGQPVSYLNWAPGAPNNAGNEDVVRMLTGGQWNDVSAIGKTFSVAESQFGACPGTGSCFAIHGTGGCDTNACCNLVCGLDAFCCTNNWDGICVNEANIWCAPVPVIGPIVNPATGRSYYRLDSALWPEAERVAIESYGHLVTINSAAENEWIRLNLMTGIDSAFIGINDQANEGTFQWVSTLPSTYLNWSAGEPNNQNGQDFGRMLANGTWDDVALNFAAVAIVEVPCTGNLNNDAQVDGLDLAIVLGSWGGCSGDCPTDINADNMVDGLDLSLVLGNWGPCPTSNCCSAHGPSCDQPGCAACVCAMDAFCCANSWDSICVNEAKVQCNAACQCSGPG